MTKRIASLIGLVLLAAVSMSAQITNKMEVKVPFSFAAAGKIWAAGTYKLDIRLDNGLGMLHSTESGSKVFLTQVTQSRDRGNTRVRFERYRNEWVLRAIVGGGLSADVLPGKLERELISDKPSASCALVARLQP